MPKYIVEYEHEVVIKYQAEVIADSQEEAIQKVEEGNIVSEEEMDYQGMRIKPASVHLLEDGE